MHYIILFLVSFILSLLLTPVAEKLSLLVDAVDHPNRRKIHSKAIPRLGGVSIYLSFVISSLLFLDFSFQLKSLLCGSIIVVVVGVIDDIKELDAKVKLAAQILAVGPILAYNLNINLIDHPLIEYLFTGYLAIPIIILWVVGMINAINLIDGLDGLAGGVVTIAALTLAIIFCGSNNLISCSLALILAGSTLGFLKYNFNPAAIFMGDTGSMFLGYTLAVISLFGINESSNLMAVLAPILVLGVPIFDINFAFFRRLVNCKNPFIPDKEHLHHRFLHFGLNQKQTVFTIYLIALIFGVSSILLAKYNSLNILLVVITILVILFLWLKEFNIIRLGSTINAEPLELLKEIRTNLIKLEHLIEDDLELASFHQELGRLEELIERVPKFIYDDEVEDIDKNNYGSLRERIFLLIEIIDVIIRNYNDNSDNLNHIFQHEKSNLLAIYDKLKSN